MKNFQILKFSKADINANPAVANLDPAKFIPNPLTGGDDDIIVVDTQFGNWTFTEHGSYMASEDWCNSQLNVLNIQDLIIAEICAPSPFDVD